MQTTNCIQDNKAFKAAFTSLYYNDSITAEESENLYNQIRQYLSTTPSCRLIEVHHIIRDMYLTSPEDKFLADLVVEVGIAKAEEAAYMNGVAYGDEPELQPYDDEEEWNAYEEGLTERVAEAPKAYIKLAQFLEDELPF